MNKKKTWGGMTECQKKEKIGVLVKFAFLITLKLITVLKFVLMSIIKGLLLFILDSRKRDEVKLSTA